jgi:hypothetical protein
VRAPPNLLDVKDRLHRPQVFSAQVPTVSAAQASELRNRLLGVGSQVVIVELAKVRRR